jgi:hypothetical protein
MSANRRGGGLGGSGLVWACGGVAAGAGLVVVIGLGLFAYRLENPMLPTPVPVVLPTPTAVPFPTAWSTPSPELAPTLTPQPTPSATAAGPTVLSDAEEALQGGSPQKAIDLLKPELGNLTRPSDLGRAYTCLGRAEMQLDHFQFAAAYFSQLYDLQPTAEHLYWLATNYDLGGDLDRALTKYQALAAMPGADADEYRDEVEARVTTLEDVVHHTPVAPTP